MAIDLSPFDVNAGTACEDPNADQLRTAFLKLNQRFALLEAQLPCIETINGQDFYTAIDTDRGNKVLTLDSTVFKFGRFRGRQDNWLYTGPRLTDADSGFVMPFDGTIVYMTVASADVLVDTTVAPYINTTQAASTITLNGTGEQSSINNLVNLDFNQGDKIKTKVLSGNCRDIIVNVYVKWRRS